MKLEKKHQKLQEELNSKLFEIEETDFLLRAIGFPEGVHSIKEVAQDLLDQDLESKGEKNG